MRNGLLIIVLFLASCSDSNDGPGKDILPGEKMEAVLWDMMSAGEFYNSYLNRLDSSFNKDSARMATYETVFRIHKIDQATFDRSYKWYQQHPEKMSILLDSLTKRKAPPTWQGQPAPVNDTMKKKMLQRPDLDVQ